MVTLRVRARFLSLALIISVMIAPFAQAAFSDVSGGEFASYVSDLEMKGIVSGTNGLFYPKRNLTRGELAKVLVKAANLPINNTGGQRFPDVPVGSTFYDYVMTLVNIGTISGYPDGTFKPSNFVTRGEFSKMTVGSFSFSTSTTGGPHFNDVPPSQTFYVQVETLYNLNIVSGYNAVMFGVNDYLNREQMAKILSRAMMSKAGTLPPRAPTVGTIKKEFPLTFNYVFPRAHIDVNDAETRFTLSVERFPRLAGGFMYEMWVKDDTGLHSVGRFNVRDGISIVDNRGIAITPNFNFPGEFDATTDMEISIEPNGDTNTTPGVTRVARGKVEHDGVVFDLDFPVGYVNNNSRAYITGTGTNNNILNIDMPMLPDVRSIGWSYEAWYMVGSTTNTAGTFNGNGGRTLFKSLELPVDLLTVKSVMVSLEPNPDDSDAPSGIIPWNGDVPGSTSTSTSGSTSADADLYKGLTTSMTTKSIRDRTVMETDTGEKVIVQAYAGSPALADGEKQAIVVKVSNLDGEPIGDLDLKLSRVEGPAASFSDPQEVGNMTGVYIGTYETEDPVATSDTVVVRVQSDSGEDVEIPDVDVEFDVSSSDQLGSPRRMEVDVTREQLVLDENDSELQNAEMLVVAGIQDSNDRGITDVLSSKLSLIADGDVLSGTIKGNVKSWKLDDGFFDLDGEDSDITVHQDFVLQLIPSGSDGWSPLISTEYEVEGKFIAEI